MSAATTEGQITDAKKRYSAGVLKYKQMGYWMPDYVPSDTDTICLFRITRAVAQQHAAQFVSTHGAQRVKLGHAVHRLA